MRVSVLKKNLIKPRSLIKNDVPCTHGEVLTSGHRGAWGVASPRLPALKSCEPAPLTKVLDKGFFFPISTPWVHGGQPYRRLVINARGSRPRAIPRRRMNSLWEILEGGKLGLIKKKRKPRAKPTSEGYTSSGISKFYSGVKPHRRRQNKKRRRLIRLLAKKHAKLGGGLKIRRAKKIAGFKRALRLLPKKKKKVRSYRHLKSVRPRAALRRVARFSKLKTPLAWSKKATKENKINPKAGLRANLAKVNSRALTPSRAYEPARGVLGAIVPRAGRVAKKKGKLKILQTRYKPGLSRAWRLLRLQFCIAWGLPWLRQRRFTNYVSQLKSITGLNFLKMCISSIGFIVRASALTAPTSSLGDKVFVNGRYVANPFFQVFRGDRVGLLTPSLPSTKRWRVFTDVIQMLPLGGWEVDGLTRSVTVWSEPSIKELQATTFHKPLPFLTFRMYNWKYRH